MRAVLAAAPIVVLGLAAAGCASSPLARQGDQAIAAGDCRAAVTAYERLLLEVERVRNLDEVLFRLAACRSLSGSGVEDRAKTEGYLERLLWGFPHSPYAVPAKALLDRDAEIGRLEGDLEAARATLALREREVAELGQRIAAATGPSEAAAPDGEKLAAELATMRARVTVLSKDLNSKLAEIDRLQRALQALKEIDLGSPP